MSTNKDKLLVESTPSSSDGVVSMNVNTPALEQHDVGLVSRSNGSSNIPQFLDERSKRRPDDVFFAIFNKSDRPYNIKSRRNSKAEKKSGL